MFNFILILFAFSLGTEGTGMLYDFIPKKNDSACTILFVVYGRSVSRFFALWTVCGRKRRNSRTGIRWQSILLSARPSVYLDNINDWREHKEAFFYPHEKQKSISPVSASSTISVRNYISNYMVFHDLSFSNLAWWNIFIFGYVFLIHTVSTQFFSISKHFRNAKANEK